MSFIDAMPTWIFWTTSGIIGLLMAGVIIWLMLYFETKEFSSYFGFKPSRVHGMRNHEQQVIEQQLREQASRFNSAADGESRALTQSPKEGLTLLDTEKNLKQREKNLRYAEDRVKRTKKAFWRAHKLAKDRGYTTHGKYTDYLQIEESHETIRTR